MYGASKGVGGFPLRRVGDPNLAPYQLSDDRLAALMLRRICDVKSTAVPEFSRAEIHAFTHSLHRVIAAAGTSQIMDDGICRVDRFRRLSQSERCCHHVQPRLYFSSAANTAKCFLFPVPSSSRTRLGAKGKERPYTTDTARIYSQGHRRRKQVVNVRRDTQPMAS